MKSRIQLALGAFCLLVVAIAPEMAMPTWKQFPAPPPMPPADESGFAPVNGISMYYAIYGKDNGPPILLIHGGLGSGDVWGFEVPELSERHEVIVADSRGQGRSSHNHERLTYHLMAEDYVDLIRYLGVGKVALVGWSDGGIIGLDIAMNHPEVLSKLFAQAANISPDGLFSIPSIDPPPPSAAGDSHAAEDVTLHEERRRAARERAFKRLRATEPNYTADDLRKILADRPSRAPPAPMVLDDLGVDLLGRPVAPEMLAEARTLLQESPANAAVRQVVARDGQHIIRQVAERPAGKLPRVRAEHGRRDARALDTGGRDDRQRHSQRAFAEPGQVVDGGDALERR